MPDNKPFDQKTANHLAFNKAKWGIKECDDDGLLAQLQMLIDEKLKGGKKGNIDTVTT